MRRRRFITLLGGAAAWPLAAGAQQQDGRVRRIGFLISGAEDSEYQARLVGFRAELAKLGWIEGQNLRIDIRFSAADLNRTQAYAAELTRLAPEVVVTNGTPATRVVRGDKARGFARQDNETPVSPGTPAPEPGSGSDEQDSKHYWSRYPPD